jgi:hypothetical protein
VRGTLGPRGIPCGGAEGFKSGSAIRPL